MLAIIVEDPNVKPEPITLDSDSESFNTNQTIPNWIKKNASWWTENKISDEEFVKSLQYLVDKGIIKV